MGTNQCEMCNTGVRLPSSGRSQHTTERLTVFSDMHFNIFETKILADKHGLMEEKSGVPSSEGQSRVNMAPTSADLLLSYWMKQVFLVFSLRAETVTVFREISLRLHNQCERHLCCQT